jgi:hypothetical protein
MGFNLPEQTKIYVGDHPTITKGTTIWQPTSKISYVSSKTHQSTWLKSNRSSNSEISLTNPAIIWVMTLNNFQTVDIISQLELIPKK